MRTLEERLNVTSEELSIIREKALVINDKNMAEDLSMTKDDIFKEVLNKEQFKAYRASMMTWELTNDLLLF